MQSSLVVFHETFFKAWKAIGCPYKIKDTENSMTNATKPLYDTIAGTESVCFMK